MSVILGAKPDHGFDEPLGLLSDCHRRIERFLGALLAVCTRRRGGPLDAAERNVLLRATEYFRVAAPRHTQDEEVSLFPQLRASRDPRVPLALKNLERLEADHESADRRHREVDALVARWVESGSLDEAAARTLAGLLTELQAIYQEHIALEDNQIFPLAASVLTSDQISRLGNEMARRRGLPPPSPAGTTEPAG